jgi:flagellar biosynthesis/type III secretory pathway chaperone
MDFENLITVLEAETEIYRQFMEIENEKTAVIIEGDINKLDGILNTEQGLHMKVQNIERTRAAALRNLGLGKKTLVDVIEMSGGEQKAKLEKLFGDLNGHINTIKKINEHNTKLVKSRLEIISAVNNLYIHPETGVGAKQQAGASKGEAMYGKDAKISRQEADYERAVVRKKL